MAVGRSLIQVLHVDDCPLVERLIADVEECLTAAGHEAPVEVLVGEYPSPTLLVNGVDVATGAPPEGLARCRLDLPTKDQIMKALQRANI